MTNLRYFRLIGVVLALSALTPFASASSGTQSLTMIGWVDSAPYFISSRSLSQAFFLLEGNGLAHRWSFGSRKWNSSVISRDSNYRAIFSVHENMALGVKRNQVDLLGGKLVVLGTWKQSEANEDVAYDSSTGKLYSVSSKKMTILTLVVGRKNMLRSTRRLNLGFDPDGIKVLEGGYCSVWSGSRLVVIDHNFKMHTLHLKKGVTVSDVCSDGKTICAITREGRIDLFNNFKRIKTIYVRSYWPKGVISSGGELVIGDGNANVYTVKYGAKSPKPLFVGELSGAIVGLALTSRGVILADFPGCIYLYSTR